MQSHYIFLLLLNQVTWYPKFSLLSQSSTTSLESSPSVFIHIYICTGINAFFKKGGSSCWIYQKYIDKGNGLDRTLRITNLKQPLRHMSTKMKANTVKAEVKFWNGWLTKGNLLETEASILCKAKVECIVQVGKRILNVKIKDGLGQQV